MTGQGSTSILPPLDADQAAHASVVLQAVRQAIGAQGGWLAFDDYLRLVLYAPGLGYYSAGSAKLGRAGDFITAPELSALFGRALARQCAQVLQRLARDGGGSGSGNCVLEFGAGTGELAATLLPALAELGALPEHYDILEVSADLAERARARLAALPAALRARVRWLDTLPAVPISGVMLANEVADALPFRLFGVDGGGRWVELGVGLGSGGGSGAGAELTLVARPADAALAAELGRLGLAGLPAGYQSELCPMLGPWVASMGAALARGAIFLIDYGLSRREYYHPQRARGTLRCHFRHRAHDDPLMHPGMQDITAWVDFTRVAEAAADAGLTVEGYCTQAAFLLGNGIEADVAGATDELQRARLASEARQLLLPQEMGEHFKVMALTRGLEGEPLRGFAYQDLRRML